MMSRRECAENQKRHDNAAGEAALRAQIDEGSHVLAQHAIWRPAKQDLDGKRHRDVRRVQ